MTDPSRTNESDNEFSRLDQELREWGQVPLDAHSPNLSASTIMRVSHQRRRLIRAVGGAMALLLLASCAWMFWPRKELERGEIASSPKDAQEIKQLQANLDTTQREIALLRRQSDMWQRSSLKETRLPEIIPMTIEADTALTAQAPMAIDGEQLDTQLQTARRNAALSQTLDQWLAIHP